MSRVQKQPTAHFSPYFGCVIMVAAVLVFGGIIGWSAYSYFVQDKAIADVTANEPVALPSGHLSDAQRASLDQRLTNFATKALNKEPADLSLSLDELNALLPMAPDAGGGTYADKLHFIGTDPANNRLTAQASLPLNKKFWEKGKRYLNGEVTFQVYVSETGPDAKVYDVKVPGRTIEPGIVRDMGRWPWLGIYHSGNLGQILQTIHRADVTATGIRLSTQKK